MEILFHLLNVTGLLTMLVTLSKDPENPVNMAIAVSCMVLLILAQIFYPHTPKHHVHFHQ